MTEYQPTPQTPDEVDISKVLIEGEYATIMGVKYKRLGPPKTPVEEAYWVAYGRYPEPGFSAGDWDAVSWDAFQKGYEASQEPKKEQKWDVVRESVKWCKEHPDESVEDYLKPHTPEQTEKLLREAFQKVQQTEEWKETQRKIDSNYDKMVEERKSQKLWNMVRDELGYSIDCCDEIVDLVEKWLPKYQSAAGSQNVDTELLVDGFNDCLTKIKGKLR
jgi:hypothetical protein